MVSCNACCVDVCPLCVAKATSRKVDAGLLLRLAMKRAPLGSARLLTVFYGYPACATELYRSPDLASVFYVAQEFDHSPLQRATLVREVPYGHSIATLWPHT